MVGYKPRVLLSASVFTRIPFVSWRFLFFDSIGWKSGSNSRCRCYIPLSSYGRFVRCACWECTQISRRLVSALKEGVFSCCVQKSSQNLVKKKKIVGAVVPSCTAVMCGMLALCQCTQLSHRLVGVTVNDFSARKTVIFLRFVQNSSQLFLYSPPPQVDAHRFHIDLSASL